jgi:hypothetical protein
LCMKAVCTTLGCWLAAAAPTGAEPPLGDVFPESVPFRSVLGQLIVGGPMEDVEVGVMSIGSRGGASVEPEDGRMGIDLCRFGLCGSGEKGLRRASATEAIMADGGRRCRDVELLGQNSAAISFGRARRLGCWFVAAPWWAMRKWSRTAAEGRRGRVTAGLAMRRECGGSMRCGWPAALGCGDTEPEWCFLGRETSSSASASRGSREGRRVLVRLGRIGSVDAWIGAPAAHASTGRSQRWGAQAARASIQCVVPWESGNLEIGRLPDARAEAEQGVQLALASSAQRGCCCRTAE